MDLSSSTGIAILGGGVAGLACALRLRSTLPSVQITLLESEHHVGGKVRGDVIGGCIVDGGPDLCVEAKLVRTRAYDALALNSQLIPVNAARLPTYRRCGGRLIEMPHVVTEGLVTMRGGMHDIVARFLAAMQDVSIRTGSTVSSVKRTHGAWTIATIGGDHIRADAVVCALPATSVTTSLAMVAPSLAREASLLRYAPLTTVSAAWAASDVAHVLRGTGYIESHARAGRVSACTWTSRKIPSRAPADVVLLRGYVRSASETATSLAVTDMRKTLGIATQPLWTRTFAWDDAVPEYASDHSARLRNLRTDLDSLEGFAVAGAAWDGVGIGDCIASGERAADHIVANSFARSLS